MAWGAALNTMSWEYYLQYGDRQLLQQAYQPMRAQLRNMQTWLTPDSTMYQQMRNPVTGELLYWLNLGDWVPPYGMPSDEIVHTFYLWLCATNAARTAAVLGDEAGRQECDAIARRTWRAFHRKFYDEATGSYGDFGPNILALYMGMPEERKAMVIEALRREIMETHDGHINTGFVTTKFFFETVKNLAESGHFPDDFFRSGLLRSREVVNTGDPDTLIGSTVSNHLEDICLVHTELALTGQPDQDINCKTSL